jgi:hypothetical protein
MKKKLENFDPKKLKIKGNINKPIDKVIIPM